VGRLTARFEMPKVRSRLENGQPVVLGLIRVHTGQNPTDNHQVYDNQNLLPPGGAWQASQAASGYPWELDLVFPPSIDSNEFSRIYNK